MPVIVDLYCRVSTDEQVREGYSLDSQERRLKLYAESMGWIINRCYVDGGYSGKNLDRPGMQAMIVDAKTRSINKVCVCMLDRLSRSQKDTMHLIEDVFLANNVDFVSMHETLDTSTPVGRAMIGVLAVFAQLERDQITERMTNGRNERIKSGKYRGGGHHAIGYGYNPAEQKLYIIPAEADAIKRAFEDFLRGETLGKISRDLNENPLMPRTNYSASHVARILDNPAYDGIQRWNGEEVRIEDFPRFIDHELFEAVKNRRAKTKRNNGLQTSVVSATMLSGLIWCGECGMRYSYSDDPKIGGKKWHRRYVCSSHRSFKKRVGVQPCSAKSIICETLDEIVLNEIRKLNTDRSIINSRENERSLRNAEIKSVSSRITEIDSQLNRLIDLYLLGKFETTQLSARTDALNEERDRLIKRLTELESAPEEDHTHFVEALDTFEGIIANNPTKRELNMLVRALINKIVIKGDDINIMWAFE